MRITKKSISLATLGAITILALTGCGARGPKFRTIEIPQKNQSLVYIYRPSSFMGAAMSYDIHVKNANGSDKVIGSLSNGGYLKYITKPEKVELWAKTEDKSSVTLDMKAGTMYCVKGELGMGIIVGRPNLTIIGNKLCQKELKDTSAIIK
jgi:hypothetical protein